jgi:hypothetical protein
MKKSLQIFCFFFFSAQICFAQWVSLGLEGKQIKDIAAHGNTVFAVTSDSGSVFRSGDEGVNWVTIIPDSVKDIALHVFSPPPIQRSMLCLIMEGDYYWNWQDSLWEGPMVLRSTDWGYSWINLDIMEILHIPDPPVHMEIMNLVIDPIGDIYCGIKHSFIGYSTTFAMSGDDGLSWTYPGWDDTLFVGQGGLLFDFRGQSVITYGQWTGHGAGGDAIHWSSDNGQSWLKIGYAPDWENTTLNLCLNGNIFLGGLSGLFISTDMCSSWTKVSSLIPECGITLPTGGILVGTVSLGVFHFSDYGDSLGSFNEGLSNLNVSALAMDNDGYLYAGTANGVWRRALSELVPVELNSFTALANGKEVTLSWSTATELNNQGFEVQRKFGSNEFVTIGSVKGQGTTTSPNQYNYVDKLVEPGKYFYRLKQIDFGGKYEYSQTVEVNWSPFTTYKLEQNYPNPFNPKTTIGFGIPASPNPSDLSRRGTTSTEGGALVTLKVYDVLGNEVRTLINKEMEAGYHSIDFNASELPSGVYFYQLRAGSFIETRKMVLLR